MPPPGPATPARPTAPPPEPRELHALTRGALRYTGVARSRSDRIDVTRAATEDRVVVTENATDFLPLLDEMIAAGDTVPAVVIALKRSLPRRAGALPHALVGRLVQWADANPEPYRHAHLLG